MNKIKQVLEQQNKTEAWLAKRVGCSVKTVHNWCNNHEEPSLNQLFKIMRVLGVQADEVWKGDE